MRNSCSVVFAVVMMLVAGLHAGAGTEDAQPCATDVMPANVEVPRDLERVLAKTYDGSSIFREQCARIAQAANLSVFLQLDRSIPGFCRAFTVVRHTGRRIQAWVHLPPDGMTSFPELIGHEFEHILEQVEGINLRKLLGVKGSGVRQGERGWLETERAIRAGRLVASEVSGRRAAN